MAARGRAKAATPRASVEVVPNVRETSAAEWVHVSAWAPHTKNPRVHREEVLNLARTILRTAWGAPVVAQWRDSGRHRGIAGHGRILALTEILAGVEVDGELRGGPGFVLDGAPGPGFVPMRIVRVSDATADAMVLADNARRLQGTDDPALLVAMASQFGPNAEVMRDLGFDAASLDRLVALAGDGVLAGGARNDGDTGPQLGGLQYRVIVECDGEAQQSELLERFEAEGLRCKPLIS